MRDSRRARLVLALLLLTAFTLITLDYRAGSGGPLRSIGNAVFGPVERAAAAVVHPVGSFFSSLGNLSSYKSTNAKLRKQNQQLRERLRLTDGERAHLSSAEKLLPPRRHPRRQEHPGRVRCPGSPVPSWLASPSTARRWAPTGPTTSTGSPSTAPHRERAAVPYCSQR